MTRCRKKKKQRTSRKTDRQTDRQMDARKNIPRHRREKGDEIDEYGADDLRR